MSDLPSIDLSKGLLNPFYPWYDLKVSLRRREVKLHISAQAASSVQELNSRVERELEWIDTEIEQIRSYLAEQLLDDRNESWRGPDEPQITPEEFKSRLNPVMVTLAPEGYLTVALDDDGLFLGHWVVSEFDAKHRAVRAYLEG